MKENHKKESPILSLLGMGGGAGGVLTSSGAAASNKIAASGGIIAVSYTHLRAHET